MELTLTIIMFLVSLVVLFKCVIRKPTIALQVEILRLEPGEILVINYKGKVSMEERDNLIAVMKRLGIDLTKVMVTDNGTEITKLGVGEVK